MTTTGTDTAHSGDDLPGELPVDLPGEAAMIGLGFTGLIGMQVVELGPDRAIISWPVRPELHQPYGIVHGGVYCTAVETVASYGAAAWMHGRGHVVGVSNQTDFLRAVREGSLTATATPVHRGRVQQLWQVEIHDDQQRLVARGQVRLQNVEDAGRLGR
jgi:uncharacterized protein (TIGR00369 family)